jgi:hypothetical protein
MSRVDYWGRNNGFPEITERKPCLGLLSEVFLDSCIDFRRRRCLRLTCLHSLSVLCCSVHNFGRNLGCAVAKDLGY